MAVAGSELGSSSRPAAAAAAADTCSSSARARNNQPHLSSLGQSHSQSQSQCASSSTATTTTAAASQQPQPQDQPYPQYAPVTFMYLTQTAQPRKLCLRIVSNKYPIDSTHLYTTHLCRYLFKVSIKRPAKQTKAAATRFR